MWSSQSHYVEDESRKMFFKLNNHKNQPKKLPRPIQTYMQYRFNMLPEYLDTLRCFEYEGLASGKRVRCIRIFSPLRAKEQHLSIRSRVELEQHPEMLLFEGHIDSQSSVYVADRRVPLTRVKAT
jgi:hypothetical protein